MSDNFVPSLELLEPGRNTGGARSTGELVSALDMGTRAKILLARDPFLAEDPNTLLAMAQMPLSPDQLIDQSGQIYGMRSAANLSDTLQRMNPQNQRRVYSTLSAGQQMALEQLGYRLPQTDGESMLGKVLGPIDEIAGAVLSPVATGIKTVGTPALRALSWIGDRPMHFYRTIRLMDSPQQILGAIGAAAGAIAGLALAPATGGLSLGLTAAAVGGGALAGATAGAAITAPGDWARAFGDSYRGERTFERGAQRQVEQLLGDPRLVGLAEDLADLDGFSMRDFIYEMGSLRDDSPQQQAALLGTFAERFASPETPEFQQVAKALYNVLGDETFQLAVATLQDGKISPGRDFADVLGIDKDTALYNVVSGISDAAFQVALDPTMAIGGAARWSRLRKIKLPDGPASEVVERYRLIAKEDSVRNYYERFVEGFREGDLIKLRTFTPEMMRGYRQFSEHIAAREIARENVTVDDVVDWFAGSIVVNRMMTKHTDKPLGQFSEGIGTMRSQRGVVLANLNRSSTVYRTVSYNVRNFVNGLTDARLEKSLVASIREAEAKGERWINPMVDELELVVPGVTDIYIDETTGKLISSRAADRTAAARAGLALGNLPGFHKVGDVLSAISTMVPAGKAIRLAGEGAEKDVFALTELARFMGMPSWAREAYAVSILNADNVGTRAALVHTWLDNALTISGLRQLEEGRRIADEYLDKSLQSYSSQINVNGRPMNIGVFANDMATELYMPDLKELQRALRTGGIGKFVGVVDSPVLETAMTRVWKPGVLLRIGFIPRAAGEELLAHMFRGGFGSLVQNYAARTVGKKITFDELQRKVRLGQELTPAETKLVALGETAILPGHIRPVAWMLEGFDWAKPVMKKLAVYADWYRNILVKGVGGAFERPAALVEAVVGREAREPALAKAFSAIAGRDFASALPPNAGFNGIARSYAEARLNVAGNLEKLFLGNRTSWRRLALGGVNDDFLAAARAFDIEWAQHLAGSVSNVDAGPFDRGFDPERATLRITEGWRGKPRVQFLVPTKGVFRTFTQKNGLEFTINVRYQARHALHDPIGGQVARQFIPRMRAGTTIDDATLNQLSDMYESITTDIGTLLRDEVLGAPDSATLRAAIDDLRFINPDLHQFAKSWLSTSEEIAIEPVLEAVRAWLVGPKAKKLASGYVDNVFDELETVAALGSSFRSLPLWDQRFAGSALRHGTVVSINESQRLLDDFANRLEDRLNAYSDRLGRAETEEAQLDLLQAYIDDLADEYDRFLEVKDLLEWQHTKPKRNAPQYKKDDIYYTKWLPVLTEHRSQIEEARQIAFRLRRRQGTVNENIPYLQQQVKGIIAKASSVRNATPKWATSWSDLEADMIDFAQSVFLDTYRQEFTQRSQRLANTDSPLKEGTRLVYKLPPISRFQRTTFESLVLNSKQSEVLLRNRDVIETWLAGNYAPLGASAGPSYAVTSNFELAQELTRLSRPPIAGAVDTYEAVRVGQKILEGKVMGNNAVVPMHSFEEAGDTVVDLWRLDAEIFNDVVKIDPTDPQGLIAKSRSSAEALVSRMREVLTSNAEVRDRALGRALANPPSTRKWDDIESQIAARREELTFLDVRTDKREYRRLADEISDLRQELEALGPKPLDYEPVVFTRDDVTGELVPVSPDDPIDPNVRYFNSDNQPVETNPRYFAQPATTVAPTGEVMWPLVGPLMEDLADNLALTMRWRPNHRLDIQPGQIVAPLDRVRAYRSKVEHVDDVGEKLPNAVLGPELIATHDNWWDRFVRYGFDRVIGPAIDALARKPIAFHFFAERYAFARSLHKAWQDPQIIAQLSDLMSQQARLVDDPAAFASDLASVRTIARLHTGDTGVAMWKDHETLAWLRTFDVDELSDIVQGFALRLQNNALAASVIDDVTDAVKRLTPNAISTLRRRVSMLDPEQFLADLRNVLPPDSLNSLRRLQTVANLDEYKDLFKYMTNDDFKLIVDAERSFQIIERQAREYASTAAINDMLPFIDSHEFRTQFAETGKNFLPFWYAEENFLKRWARTAIDMGPLSTIRKAQLAYAGLKSGGVIRTDENGRDWFVYPGSGFMVDIVSKVFPGAGNLPIGAMFQAPTDRMLPGLTAERVGQPSFSPLVQIPAQLLQARIPELEPLSRKLFGDVALNQGSIQALVPTQVQNFFNAFFRHDDSNRRFMSAQLSAMAMLEATDQGLSADATPGERDEYLRKVADHARIIVLAQAFMGFFVPGAPQQFVTAQDDFDGMGVEDPVGVVNKLYWEIVKDLGIEEGTIKFLEMYPQANIHHIIGTAEDGSHPVLALLEGKTKSRSGAPLPATTDATVYFQQHQEYMTSVPFAGPWLLPPQGTDERTQYAYDQQTINDLRIRQTPEDFLNALKFKEGATPYFNARKTMQRALAQAEIAGDEAQARSIREQWDLWATTWKASHPVFAEQLESGAGRQRRQTTISEMRRVVNDPSAPDSVNLVGLRNMMSSFDNYTTLQRVYSTDRSREGRVRLESMKVSFEQFMDDYVEGNSVLQAFWTSVLRPESNLE